MVAGINYTQYLIFNVTFFVAGTLSGLGSLAVIRMASARLRKGTKPIYQRLMITLSLFDIFDLIAYCSQIFWGGIEGTTGGPWAIGTRESCTAVSYFHSVFSLSATLCNTSLAVYYLLIVRYSWKSEEISRVQYIWYPVILMVPQFIGIPALATQSYNPTRFADACWLGEYTCATSGDGARDPDCVPRGGPIAEYLRTIHLVILVVSSLSGFLCTYLVWSAFRKRVKASQRHTFHGSGQDTNNEHMREVTGQAVLYSLCHLNGFVWSCATFGVGTTDATGSTFAAVITPAIFFGTLQGFLNSMVCTRPTFRDWRQKHPSMSRIQVLNKCLRVEDVSSEIMLRSSKSSGRISNQQNRIVEAIEADTGFASTQFQATRNQGN